MRYPKYIRLLGHVIDGAMALVFVIILLLILNTWPIYWFGDNFLHRFFEILYWLLMARLMTLVPWADVVRRGPKACAALVLLGGALAMFLHVLILTNFWSAAQAIVITRGSFAGATDREIAEDITEYNKWYPRMSFVHHILDTVPEDASIAYFGDQRAHIMSYLLYPRKVYVLPRLQIILNETIQDNWTWSHLEDPFHPQEDPLNPRLVGDFSKDDPSEEVQQDLLRMIDEREIGWIMYYDSIYPDKSWIRKLEP